MHKAGARGYRKVSPTWADGLHRPIHFYRIEAPKDASRAGAGWRRSAGWLFGDFLSLARRSRASQSTAKVMRTMAVTSASSDECRSSVHPIAGYRWSRRPGAGVVHHVAEVTTTTTGIAMPPRSTFAARRGHPPGWPGGYTPRPNEVVARIGGEAPRCSWSPPGPSIRRRWAYRPRWGTRKGR
jgi:hypothetical protein